MNYFAKSQKAFEEAEETNNIYSKIYRMLKAIYFILMDISIKGVG